MLLYRKDEIVEKAAESNQLLMCERTPVQFLQDYYNEDWHIKAGTLAYVKVGTVLTTITESDGKSVECRIIANLVAGKNTIEIPAIAFDDGTLLVKGAKRDPSPCSEVFAPPFDGDLHTMMAYEEIYAKVVKNEYAYDTTNTIADGVTILIGIVLVGFGCFRIIEPDSSVISTSIFMAVGSICSIGAFSLFWLSMVYNHKETNRKLADEKMILERELLRKDAENVQAYEKGDPNGRSSF